jgi:hypothetical protein
MVLGQLLAEPGYRSAVRTQKSGEAEKQRRFPRSGATNESYDLRGVDVERDIAQRWGRYGSGSRPGMVCLIESPDG